MDQTGRTKIVITPYEDRIEITVYGERTNKEQYSDTFELTPEQYQLLIDCVQQTISRLDGTGVGIVDPDRVALYHRYRMRNNPHYKDKYDALIWLVCHLDF